MKLSDILKEYDKVLLDKDFTCRLTEDDDEDIIKALKCIYSHYGMGYLHQDLYDMDYFHEVLRSGRYVAAVAENRSGQVMGFGAIDAHPWFPGLMEMGGLVVNPIARGLGLGDMLDDCRIEVGRQRGIRGLFSTPIMPNPASQKLLSRHGFIPTGMYFHAGGPESLGGSGDGVHCMDCGFSVYIYDKDALHALHAPDECKEFITDIYNSVGLKYNFEKPTEKPLTDTVMDFNHETEQNLLEVKIIDIGQNFREKVDELPLDDEEVEAIMLLMGMTDPLCPECYEYLRGQGFIFTGCVPGGEDDLIVLEHLKKPVDRGFLAIEPDYERVLDLLYEINGVM
ncbi:MAG: GNAT family N-acetyltransferase [Firmicutes bacterium]|nr:GNAT family N-acetyltransferase [Bacillota bacterium]